MRRLGWPLALVMCVLAQGGCATLKQPCGVEAPALRTPPVARRPWLFDLSAWHPWHSIEYGHSTHLPGTQSAPPVPAASNEAAPAPISGTESLTPVPPAASSSPSRS
jgi:hypothetical protein